MTAKCIMLFLQCKLLWMCNKHVSELKVNVDANVVVVEPQRPKDKVSVFIKHG